MRRLMPAVLGFLFFVGAALPAFAYTDEIALSADKVWKATQEVMKKDYGIRKMDAKKMTLETQAQEDRVTRSRGFLKKAGSFIGETYLRRYTFKVKLTDEQYSTTVEIKGVFREKPLNSGPVIVNWKRVKAEEADYDVERAAFMRILNNLQHQLEEEQGL